jgi:hypothetical protein
LHQLVVPNAASIWVFVPEKSLPVTIPWFACAPVS